MKNLESSTLSPDERAALAGAGKQVLRETDNFYCVRRTVIEIRTKAPALPAVVGMKPDLKSAVQFMGRLEKSRCTRMEAARR